MKAIRKMLRQRVFAEQDKLFRELHRREKKHWRACMGLGPMSVEAWLRYFDMLDAMPRVVWPKREASA